MAGTPIDTSAMQVAFAPDLAFLAEFFTEQELIQRYRVSGRYIRRMAREGRFPRGKRIFKVMRYPRAAVLAAEQALAEVSG